MVGLGAGWMIGVTGFWVYCQTKHETNRRLQHALLMAQSRPVDPVTLEPLPDDRSPELLAARARLLPPLPNSNDNNDNNDK